VLVFKKDYEPEFKMLAIFPENSLHLSIYTVVIKQGNLPDAAVYDIKIRMEWTKTGYLMTLQLTYKGKW